MSKSKQNGHKSTQANLKIGKIRETSIKLNRI